MHTFNVLFGSIVTLLTSAARPSSPCLTTSGFAMEAPEGVVKTVKDFAKGSYRLVKRCNKPDRKGEGPGRQPAHRVFC